MFHKRVVKKKLFQRYSTKPRFPIHAKAHVPNDLFILYTTRFTLPCNRNYNVRIIITDLFTRTTKRWTQVQLLDKIVDDINCCRRHNNLSKGDGTPIPTCSANTIMDLIYLNKTQLGTLEAISYQTLLYDIP